MFARYGWGTRGTDVECISGQCPSPQSSSALVPPVIGVRRARSPLPAVSTVPHVYFPLLMAFLQPPPRKTRRRQGSPPLTDRVSETDPESESGIQDDDDLPDISELPRMPPDELEDWQYHIRLHKKGHFFLSAPKVDVGAAAFIHILKSLLSGTLATEYSPESSSVRCDLTDSEALLDFAPRPFSM